MCYIHSPFFFSFFPFSSLGIFVLKNRFQFWERNVMGSSSWLVFPFPFCIRFCVCVCVDVGRVCVYGFGCCVRMSRFCVRMLNLCVGLPLLYVLMSGLCVRLLCYVVSDFFTHGLYSWSGVRDGFCLHTASLSS